MVMESGDVTRLLADLAEDGQDAMDRVFPLVYDELHRVAQRKLQSERPDHTLNATALVHEAYLRLFGATPPRWDNRAHFFGAAAEAMRRILIERARRQARQKRGGTPERVPLADLAAESPLDPETLIALDSALGDLEQRDGAMARVVKLRYFAGLTVDETASALDLAPRTVDRQWTAARAWLKLKLARQTEAPR